MGIIIETVKADVLGDFEFEQLKGAIFINRTDGMLCILDQANDCQTALLITVPQ